MIDIKIAVALCNKIFQCMIICTLPFPNSRVFEGILYVSIKIHKPKDYIIPEVLCKNHCGNSHLEWWFANGTMPHYVYSATYSLTTNEVKFHLHKKDYKWGRKLKFRSWKNHNRRPLQIPLQ